MLRNVRVMEHTRRVPANVFQTILVNNVNVMQTISLLGLNLKMVADLIILRIRSVTAEGTADVENVNVMNENIR